MRPRWATMCPAGGRRGRMGRAIARKRRQVCAMAAGAVPEERDAGKMRGGAQWHSVARRRCWHAPPAGSAFRTSAAPLRQGCEGRSAKGCQPLPRPGPGPICGGQLAALRPAHGAPPGYLAIFEVPLTTSECTGSDSAPCPARCGSRADVRAGAGSRSGTVSADGRWTVRVRCATRIPRAAPLHGRRIRRPPTRPSAAGDGPHRALCRGIAVHPDAHLVLRVWIEAVDPVVRTDYCVHRPAAAIPA